MSNIFITDIVSPSGGDLKVPESDTEIATATSRLDTLISGVALLAYDRVLAWVEDSGGPGGAYRGLYIQIDCNTGDTLENARAIQIDGPTGSGTFTNLPAAIMILDQKTGPQSGIANPISIYAPGSSDKAVFGGLMVVGGLTNPASVSVGLEVQGTTKAFLVSRMTTTQRNALTAVNGMIIYNTSTNAFNFYENGSWVTGSGLA